MLVTREYAHASMDIWADGTGDPLRQDPGFGVYHSFDKKSIEGMLVSVNAAGQPLGEFIDEVGITPRPILVPKDTRLFDFDVTPADKWDERQPTGGIYRTYRLWMYDGSTGTTAWSAVSKYVLSGIASYAISLMFEETVADWWDVVGQQPYLRIEIAGGAYAIYWEKHRGTFFLRRNGAGGWDPVKKLSGLQKIEDTDERLIYIRANRGRVLISMDGGEDWTEIGDDENPIYLPTGKIGFFGAGFSCGIGVHQLDYSTIRLRPMVGWSTFWPRAGVSAVLQGWYDVFPGAGVAFSDVGNLLARVANYEAVVTPTTVGNYPFAVKAAPALHGVQLNYPFTRVVTSDATTNELDEYIEAVTIDKPASLSGARATVRLDMRVADALTGNWKLRKVRLKLGYVMSDQSLSMVTSFTGYVTNISEDWHKDATGYRRKVVMMEISNASEALRRSRWTDLDCIPFGGWLPNEVADYILKSVGWMDWAGLDTSYRSWDLTGWLEAFRLPLGKYEDRHEMIKPDEEKWNTLTRVQGTCGCEAGVFDDGTLFTVPINHVESTPTWTFRATSQNSTDIREQMTRLNVTKDFSEGCTAVMVVGKLRNGMRAMAFSVDDAAELLVASGRFSRWRETLRQEIDGTTSPDVLVNTNVMLSQYNFGIWQTAELGVPWHPNVYRHQRVNFLGCSGVGVPDAVDHGVRTIRHHFERNRPMSTLETAIGVWRI